MLLLVQTRQVRPLLEQEVQHGLVAGDGAHVERGEALVVGGVQQRRVTLEQVVGTVCVEVFHAVVQRRAPTLVCR